MRDTTKPGSGWLSATFLVVIAVFGIVLIGHGPKWPIYVTILSWIGFVFYRANCGVEKRIGSSLVPTRASLRWKPPSQ